jgi:hypothetical protein
MLSQISSDLGKQLMQELTSQQQDLLQSQAKEASQKLAVQATALVTQAANEIRSSALPLVPLEVVTIRLCGPTVSPAQKAVEQKETLSIKDKQPDTNTANELLAKWSEALNLISADNVGVAGLLRSAVILSFARSNLVVAVAYPFYRERLMARHNRQLIEEHVESVTSSKVILSCKTLAELNDEERTIYDAGKQQGIEQESNIEPVVPKQVENLTQMAVDLLGGQVID